MGVPSGVPSYMLEDLCLWFTDDRMSCGKESLIQATSVSGGPGRSTVNGSPVNGSMVNIDGRSVKGQWAVGR